MNEIVIDPEREAQRKAMREAVSAYIEQNGPVIVQNCGDSKGNARAAYEVALVANGLPADTREGPWDMFQRAGDFAFALIDELGELTDKHLEHMGLIGGLQQGTLADIRYSNKDDAKRAFDLAEAMHHAVAIKTDICLEMIKYGCRG